MNLPKSIFFNRGCLEEALKSCAAPDHSGSRCMKALVVTDNGMRQCGHLGRLVEDLEDYGFEVDVFDEVLPGM
jgi:alcohol dehydrogenase class IV